MEKYVNYCYNFWENLESLPKNRKFEKKSNTFLKN